MRVLCITPQNVKHETAMFIGLKQKGIDMHVITCRKNEPDYSELQAAGIPVHIITLRSRLDRDGIEQIRNIIITHNIEIVHAFNNKTVSNALRASKGLSVKFIAYRGIVGNVSFLNPGSWMTYLNPRVNRIICVADAIRIYLLKLRFLWMKIPTHKLVTIHKGHNMAWYQKPPHNLAEFNIPKNAFVVGCTTNYRPRKGIEILIAALQHLPAAHNIHLLLIGNMDNSGLLKQIEASPYRTHIHLTGYRSNAPEIIAACDACILPSIKREGLPKTIIEGMAYGVPPIVTDSGGSPELVENGISGIVIPPKSAKAIAESILYLYQNTEKRTQMGAAAKQRICDAFDVKQTIDKTFRLYQELITTD